MASSARLTIALTRGRLLRIVLLLVLLGGIAAPRGVTAQSSAGTCEAVAAGSTKINVRNGPSTEEYGVIGGLWPGQSLPVIGQDESGGWYAVTYTGADGQPADEAWVSDQVVTLRGACADLPMRAKPGQPAEVAQLEAVPVLPELDGVLLDHLREVAAHGQSLGSNLHGFTKVGDCNTDTSYFLAGFDQDNYDLGRYPELQPTVDYFAGWWEHISLAGQVGLNTSMMVDPMFANPQTCPEAADGGVLLCEYRREHPSVAVMMFGPNDLINLSDEQFTEAVTRIVTLSLDEGVIPVLTTFTWHHDDRWLKALRFNMVTVEIAAQYQVPLINFWRAAQTLPNFGLMEDYTHLTDSGPTERYFEILFNGQETFSGYALRNLLTLQMLDLLRRDVLEPAESAS